MQLLLTQSFFIHHSLSPLHFTSGEGKIADRFSWGSLLQALRGRRVLVFTCPGHMLHSANQMRCGTSRLIPPLCRTNPPGSLAAAEDRSPATDHRKSRSAADRGLQGIHVSSSKGGQQGLAKLQSLDTADNIGAFFCAVRHRHRREGDTHQTCFTCLSPHTSLLTHLLHTCI